jgi:Na+-transporting methylmalonyl-CoA/oxaloacetate decarboxylase beta subunit
MRILAAIALAVCLLPRTSPAAALDLAVLTCEQYENEVLPAAATNPKADSLDTVMWLYGFSVGKSGRHVMYTDALAPFGFGLDNECKSNPNEILLQALVSVKPEAKNPMDIAGVECAPFAARHVEFSRTDADSAKTIMMWLYGFSVAKSKGHLFDADSFPAFEAALLADCAKHPEDSLVEVLSALKISKTAKAPAKAPR